MPAKKKPFIDKNKAVSFHLVHRSQKDPLQADEDAPQRVLLPVDEKQSSEIRKDALKKFGIHYDDDYDYLQHLKDANEINDVGPGVEVYRVETTKKPKGTVQLSSELFASKVETEVGLLNKAAPVSGPQIDWDPDIVAALDDDFDYDEPGNLLDDDFVSKANSDAILPEAETEAETEIVDKDDKNIWADFYAHRKSTEADEEADSSSADGDGSEIASLESFGDVETKSHFTNYSMTSSVIKRNQGLTLLDERFEKLFSAYDDDEMGAIDHEEIEGNVKQNSEVLNSLLDEFEKEQVVVKLKDAVHQEPSSSELKDDFLSDGEQIDDIVEPQKEKWDCESILSTYSNIYNHPKQIIEPKMRKTPSVSLSLAVVEETPEEMKEKASTTRPVGETLEEKKIRKQLIKEERRGRREEKKEHKTAFKAEEIRQHKEHLNLKKNMQTVKL